MTTNHGSSSTADDLAQQVVEAVERLRRVGGVMWSRIEDGFGISDVQATVLEAVAGGARQVSTVADHCGRHVSSASRVVDGLVQRGLLDRAEDPQDRRAVHLTLTDEGRELAERILAAHAEVLEASLAQLDAADAAEFVSLLQDFAAAMEDSVEQVSLD